MSNRYWAVGIRYWAVGTRYCAIRFDVRYLAVGIRYWAVCIRSRAVSIRYYRYHIVWRRDSLLVRLPDSRSNACEFESRQKWRENFFFRVNFVCWLFFNVFIRCPFHPRVTAVARKRPRSFCKSAGGRLHLSTYTPLTQWSWSGLTMPLSGHSVGTYPETSSRNLSGNILPQSSQLAEPL